MARPSSRVSRPCCELSNWGSITSTPRRPISTAKKSWARHWKASTTAYHIEPIIRTGRFDILLTALNYSLLWREAAHRALPAAHEHNMGIVIGSPLQMGARSPAHEEEIWRGVLWLGQPRQQQFCALYDFAREVGISLPELSLRFVLSDPRVSCALMGARS